MLPCDHDPFDGFSRGRADLGSLADKPLLGPSFDKSMCLRHVFGDRGISVICRLYLMPADMLMIVVDLDNETDLIDIDIASGKMVRNAVVVFFEAGVIVGRDADTKSDTRYFKPFGGQRLCIGPVEFIKALSACFSAIVFHGAVVKKVELFSDGIIDLVDGEELAVAETGKDKTLDMKYIAFRNSLVLGLSYASRQYGHAVMIGHFLIKRVCNRIISVRLLHAALQVVGDKSVRGNTEIGKTPDMGLHKIRDLLGTGGFRIGVAAGTPGTDKELKRDDFSGGPFDIFNAIAGVINEQLVAAFVHHVHGYRMRTVAGDKPIKCRTA